MLIKKPFKKGMGFNPTPYYAAVASYTAQGVSFAASTHLDKPSALTGVTDSKTGMISFWFKATAGTDANTIRIFSGSNSLLLDRIATTDVMRVICINAAASNILIASTTGAFAVGGGWHHFLASWNLATSIVQFYVNDVSDVAGGPFISNDTIAYATNGTDWEFADVGLPGPFDIADFWFDPNQAPLDLSVIANRRKFISAGLAPVNLGAAGATPTGTSPAVFCSGAAASWNTNKGTGGGFTSSGTAIATASTNPP